MSWVTVSVISKFFYLIGSAAVVGGPPSYHLLHGLNGRLTSRVLFYIVVGALVGTLASGSYFLAQVGAINDSGITGMLDWSMARLLVETNLGFSAGWRIGGLLLSLLLVLLLSRSGRFQRKLPSHSLGIAALTFVIAGSIALSFPLVGHVSVLPTPYKFLLSLHVLAVMAWIGSLTPLWLACSEGTPNDLQKILEQYGKAAMIVVSMLVISGAITVFELLRSIGDMVDTAYGRSLLIKLFGVVVLLLLAARHKLSLVPKLNSETTKLRLKRSIRVEIIVGVAVLAITAYTTTAVGPSMVH